MKFSELTAQVKAWLQRQGRVSYRALKREFELDDDDLADLKAELIDAQRVAARRGWKSAGLDGDGINGETDESDLEPGLESKGVQGPKPSAGSQL